MQLDRLTTPIVDLNRFSRGLVEYARYIRSWNAYKKLEGAEKLKIQDAYPCLYDRTSKTGIDAHYFYQGVWAMRKIKNSGETEHVDVGSLVSFVGLLSTIVKVVFIDIRPAPVALENFESRAGSILALPFEDGAIRSLSCLHVAEHIGLGRYGDPLDPFGTKKAALELSRVLAEDGHLYFSLPVGLPRVQFNAHRIHSPDQLLGYFSGLELVSFSAVTDKSEFKDNIVPSEMEHARYACGMFHFTKKRRI
jgi:SAM-dependent methyltransferase